MNGLLLVPGVDPAVYTSDRWSLSDIEQLLAGPVIDVRPLNYGLQAFVTHKKIKRSVVLAVDGPNVRSMDWTAIFYVCTLVVLEEHQIPGVLRPLREVLS